MRLSILVSWRVNIVNFEVALLFGLVDSEEKVLTGDNFLVGSLAEGFLVELVFKVLQNELLFNDLVDLRFYLLDFRDV